MMEEIESTIREDKKSSEILTIGAPGED